ncbi:MAG TPA: HAD-IA family hydrolase [Xanthobacteraceae bacterium]|jgi:putative hydrolase of the HAD superfamily
MSASPPGADALLFDLGRVVIDIDFNLVFARWAAHARCDGELIAARFRHDDAYKRHERGEIDENAYFDTLRSSLGIEISDAQFLDGWNAIFVGEMPGIADLLGRASRQVPLYAFTNSNRAHERCWSQRFATALGHFRRIYVSSTIGLRKPEPEAFDHVIREIGVPADRLMFFDDALENVDAARARRIQSIYVKSVADVENALSFLAF